MSSSSRAALGDHADSLCDKAGRWVGAKVTAFSGLLDAMLLPPRRPSYARDDLKSS